MAVHVEDLLREEILKLFFPYAGKVAVASLEPFSDQELWDELKKRGARIVDGTLRIVKEVTLR